MNYRQWVVDAVPWEADALTLEAGDTKPVLSSEFSEQLGMTENRELPLVVMRCRLTQIHAGEQHKNICLNKRYANVQRFKCHRERDRDQ